MKFHKDFGYSSFGNEAQGNWTAHADTSTDAVRVEFYLDNLLQFNDTEAPFAWSYYTDNYAEGLHTIKAVAYDASGNSASAEGQQKFVPFPVEETMAIILASVIGVIVAAVAAVVWMRRTKNKKRP